MLLGPASFRRVLVVAAIACTALGACSGQGEGQLCSLSAGHMGADDCQDGLICVTSPAYMLGRCCPKDPSRAKTDICSPHSGGLDANPVPPDTDASTDTSAGDTSADSPRDASSEVGMGIDASDAAAADDVSDATLE